MSDKLTDTVGKDVLGYFNAGDGKTGKPSVIVIHEWYGLNDQIRGVADRYVREGFVAFAPDLYQGKLATDDATAEKYMKGLDWARAVEDIRHAVQALVARDAKTRVGITGFCMGGAVALAAAAAVPELAACVPFYGIPEKADYAKMKAKVQGHFANKDGWITPAKVDALEKTLKGAGVPVEVFRYDAGHAFMREGGKAYSPDDAKKAWERAVSFLKASLK